ncbi:MAG: mechanosensitive ion channel family protein [Phycisphaerae bacterium]
MRMRWMLILLLVGLGWSGYAPVARAQLVASTEPSTAPTMAPATQPGRVAVITAQETDLPSSSDPGVVFAPSSPRYTMFTFLAALGKVHNGREENWSAALGCLDFRGQNLDFYQQRDLALMLKQTLDRLGTIRPEDLPDAATAAQAGVTRFQFFPRPVTHDWVYEKVPNGVPGTIELVRQPGGHWQFSSATVATLPGVYRALVAQPIRHDANNQLVEVVFPTWERTPLRGWISLVLALLIGVATGRGAKYIVKRFAQRCEAMRWHARSIVLHDLANPLSLLLTTGGIAVGLQFIYVDVSLLPLAQKIISLLVILALGWFLFNLVDLVKFGLEKSVKKHTSRISDLIMPLISRTLRIFVVVMLSLVIAQNVFGMDLTGWLAGLGVAGLAISLAAQDSVKNLFGSVTVFLDQPFVLGERILFDGVDGFVEDIGFRSTKVRTLEGNLVTLPNMMFIDKRVENISRRPSMRRIVNVTVTYDTTPANVARALEIIHEVMQEPAIKEGLELPVNPPQIHFTDFNADSLNLQVMYWYQMKPGRDLWTYLAHADKVNLGLFTALTAANIEFAFPTQTLYLAGDPKRPLNPPIPESKPA